jgi:hypothetical protein
MLVALEKKKGEKKRERDIKDFRCGAVEGGGLCMMIAATG